MRDTTSKNNLLLKSEGNGKQSQGDRKDSGLDDSGGKNTEAENVEYRQLPQNMDNAYQKSLQQLAFFAVPKVPLSFIFFRNACTCIVCNAVICI